MSSDTTDEVQELLRLKAAEVRVFLPPAWLTRKFVILVLLGMFTVGAVPVSIIMTVADQWLRNYVDEVTGEPDMYESVAISPEEYLRLPLHWRQALAEISVRPETAEMAETRELMKTLTPEQMALMDKIAPYVIEGFLVRDTDRTSNHPMPGLLLVDFGTLEDLGILQDVQRGHRINDLARDSLVVLRGTTAALRLQGSDPESAVSLPVTRLTELGNTLIGLLRVPSEIRYFEWIAKEVDQDGVDVQMWTTGAHLDSAVQVQRDLVAPWP